MTKGIDMKDRWVKCTTTDGEIICINMRYVQYALFCKDGLKVSFSDGRTHIVLEDYPHSFPADSVDNLEQ